MNQAQQRQHLLRLRKSCSAVKRHIDSIRIGTRLLPHISPSAKKFASYIAVNSEVSTRHLHRLLSRRGAQIYVPHLLPDNTMAFVPLAPHSRYRCNQYGITEPRFSAMRQIRAKRLDTWLVPLVGFDRRGHRIGMGGGFYDRALAQIGPRNRALIGLAFGCQQLPKITPAPWDKTLTAIACPSIIWRRLGQK